MQLKLEHPRRTLDGIIYLLEKSGQAEKGQIKRSTLHRIFQARNINIRTAKKTEAFGRFEAEFTNDRWQSDMMFGPWLPDPERPGKKFQAILIAFLDDHSRLIVHGHFYRHQSVDCLEDVLKKAIQKRGIPKVIYVDNGKAYRSSHLTSICAHLGIRLNFTEPYSPEGKGKIEKFWSFVRSSFLPEVEAAQILDMDQLNQSFQAWLEVFYHQKTHGETEETPMLRFLQKPDRIRRPDPDVFQKAFLYEEKRRITKACTFSLKNRDYEVYADLVKQTVTIMYDPEDMTQVRVYVAGQFYQIAKPMVIKAHVGKKPIKPVTEKTVTGIQHLKTLTDEFQQATAHMLTGAVPRPTEVSDAVMTAELFVAIMTRYRTLDHYEEKAIRKFFKAAGEIRNPGLAKILDLSLRKAGADKHIDYYLSIVKGV